MSLMKHKRKTEIVLRKNENPIKLLLVNIRKAFIMDIFL